MLETAKIPFDVFISVPSRLPGAYGLSLASALAHLAPLALHQVALAWILSRPSWSSASFARRLGIVASLSLVAAAYVHRTLIAEEVFTGYLPLFAIHAGLMAALTAAYFYIGHSPRGGDTTYRMSFVVVLGGAFALLYYLDSGLYRRQYPTLHSSNLQASFLLLVSSMALGLRSLERRVAKVALLSSAAIVLLGSAALLTVARKDGRPYFLRDTVLGQGELYATTAEWIASASTTRRALPRREPDAVAHFLAKSGMPSLPDDFRLEEYNVLLVTSEATRHDDTSLFRRELGTTPNLVALRDRGAYSFRRAYAPATATLQSMGALLGMRYPSALALETWKKSWHGRLRDEVDTVAEAFAAAGYDTFWASHSIGGCFRERMTGVGQGFARQRLIEVPHEGKRNADEEVLRAALEELAQAKARSRRFFGWVFFVSPHAPYFAHDDSQPGETARDRYRQEIRYMDKRLGELVGALEQSGELDRTIIVYAGDHGEEFSEHGGTYHKSTVYGEVARVPLSIFIPGIRGQTVEETVSTLYVFPWLLLRAPDVSKRTAVDAVATVIGPMMKATGDAVVVELLGHDRMLTSLVHGDRSIHYDYRSEVREVYDLDSDPLEQKDLYDHAPAIVRDLDGRLDAYLRVRAAHERFSMVPDKRPPSEERLIRGPLLGRISFGRAL